MAGNVIYGRKSAIWARESVRKRYRIKILWLEYILRKSKKIAIFHQKNHSKNFQSRFLPADLSRATNLYGSKIHPIGPPNPYNMDSANGPLPHFPTSSNFAVRSLKPKFFNFFHLSDLLKYIYICNHLIHKVHNLSFHWKKKSLKNL